MNIRYRYNRIGKDAAPTEAKPTWIENTNTGIINGLLYIRVSMPFEFKYKWSVKIESYGYCLDEISITLCYRGQWCEITFNPVTKEEKKAMSTKQLRIMYDRRDKYTWYFVYAPFV